jgi:hypothetical protein
MPHDGCKGSPSGTFSGIRITGFQFRSSAFFFFLAQFAPEVWNRESGSRFFRAKEREL